MVGNPALPSENGGVTQPRSLGEGRAADRLSELLGHHVQFAYTAWDRIVLNGHLDQLQRTENVIHFFRELVGVPNVSPESSYPAGEVQVLSPMHRGEAGVGALNLALQERLNPAVEGGPEARSRGRAYRPGDRVLQLKNDYDLKVFNGDLGTIRGVDPAEQELLLAGNRLGQSLLTLSGKRPRRGKWR